MSAMPRDFEGRTALVTGAAGGIGLAIAQRLAAGGARVVLCDRDEARLQAAACDVPGGALALAGDIGSEQAVENLVARAVTEAGRIDVLVNNAGIAQPLMRTTDQDIGAWQDVIDVNLRGTFLVSRAVGRHILSRKAEGAIVSIASIAGLVGLPGSNAYGVSKAAIVHLTRTLACEWAGRGIRVNCVAPGYIEAPMAFEMFADSRIDRRAIEVRTPMRRLGQPREIADAVAFLASGAASFVTGVTLPVDGGWCAYGGP
ncbi:MAG: SDR family oxidoreductase [Rhizobiales bacterium]|nr:SDR family oxidoreductase [Hyphomicrobiales bacterium]